MNTQKFQWTAQVIACISGFTYAIKLAFLAGRANQPMAFLIMVMVAAACAVLANIRIRQNPYT